MTDESAPTHAYLDVSTCEQPPFFLVGIGASAGGLESLEQFFANVPRDSGMAFVVIQHLSPDFKSIMGELLARHTSVPIHQASEGLAVAPNNIYLLPPKKEMIVSGGRLHMADKDLKQLTLPIDHFFRSLAQDFGQRSVAVILSGTGSDGSRGIRDVHKVGGLVLCEDAQTAKFDGMPLAAQETGVVDLVLRANEMAGALVSHAASPQEAKLRGQQLETAPLEGVEAVFDLLRRAYDIDFSHYKPTTVSRRIERRLGFGEHLRIDDYVARLQDDPEELNSLYQDLLIGVTQFFRDTDPFLRLEREVIPDLLSRVPVSEEIRVWSAACATGEEPYSLAILLHEALERAGRPVHAKIFATDVHNTSLEYAATGLYDERRLSEVSPSRLKRYFTKTPKGYQVSKDLRQMIVFARHNIIKDAPFTNLDLITCRNLLIYFQPPAQRKAISLFHFGLKTGASLLLGSSENPGELSDEFETIDERCKLYRKRRDIRLPADMRLPLSSGISRITNTDRLAGRPFSGRSAESSLIETYDLLLDRFMPPSLLVNARRELIESFGGAERFLKVRGRRVSNDLLDMLKTDAKTSIAGGLNRVMQHGQPLSFSGVSLEVDGAYRQFRIEIAPIHNRKTNEFHYLLSLVPSEDDSPEADKVQDVDADEMSRGQMEHLESRLKHTQENLQATIEELETSNEEMQATNEELVASNEELQSTNEELHSVNEELYTVNAEHQKKIHELAEMNQDMEHLLRSNDVTTVFLDRELCIRKFTKGRNDCFEFVPHDVGRRIATFSHRLRYDQLSEKLANVLNNGQAFETEVRDIDGRCFFMRILPFLVENRIEGVVLSLIDITVLDAARDRISQLSEIVESSNDAIISKAIDGVIRSWNAGAERLYGYSADEAIGKHISLIIPELGLEEARAWLRSLSRGETIAPMEVERITKDGRSIRVQLTLSAIVGPTGEVTGASAIAHDITELTKIRQDKEASERQTRLLLESTAESIYGLDKQGNCTFANPACVRLLGYDSADELLGRHMHSLIHHTKENGEPYPDHDCLIYKAFQRGEQIHLEEELLWRKDGTSFYAELWAHPMLVDGSAVGAVVTYFDTTARKQAVDQLRMEIKNREQFLAMLSHELRNPLSAVQTATRLLSSPNVPPQAEQESRRVIERQSAHMNRLLDDLLDVSRMTQDKITLEKQVIDLRETVEDAVESVQALADEAEIEIEVLMPESPLMVEGDAVRLQQIQANLLTNAIKYSPRGEKVTLRISQENSEAVVHVRDNGDGVAPELLDSIFDMFVQADVTFDRSRGGMGVGLTLVKKLVELHGGSVIARSEGQGKGSEFEVRLPVAPRTVNRVPKPLSATRSSVESSTGQRVIVIEDKDDNRHMLICLLELEGFEVQGAVTGNEGLQTIARSQFDAGIIDIGLPEMDGYEVARRIRADEANGQRMMLIALTGFGQPQDVQRALDAGFDHHLVKPLQPNRLLEVLNQGSGKAKTPSTF